MGITVLTLLLVFPTDATVVFVIISPTMSKEKPLYLPHSNLFLLP